MHYNGLLLALGGRLLVALLLIATLVLMGIGGLIAGFAVALHSGAVGWYTRLREDASFSGFTVAHWRWVSRWFRCGVPR